MQFYIDESQANEKWSLPDGEVFWADAGDLKTDEGEDQPAGFYWWPCFPGCLPDGEACGPFDSEEAAVKSAREIYG